MPEDSVASPPSVTAANLDLPHHQLLGHDIPNPFKSNFEDSSRENREGNATLREEDIVASERDQRGSIKPEFALHIMQVASQLRGTDWMEFMNIMTRSATADRDERGPHAGHQYKHREVNKEKNKKKGKDVHGSKWKKRNLTLAEASEEETEPKHQKKPEKGSSARAPPLKRSSYQGKPSEKHRSRRQSSITFEETPPETSKTSTQSSTPVLSMLMSPQSWDEWAPMKDIPGCQVDKEGMSIEAFWNHMKNYTFDQATCYFSWHVDWLK